MSTFNWSSLIPSLIGGLVAGTFAILATWFTYGHNRRLNQKQHQRKINGILMAIYYEVEIATDILRRKAGSHLEQLKDGEPYKAYFSLTEEYFIVYPNNTETIGQIDDGELCKAIIDTYNTANYALEGLRINNWYLDKLTELRQIQIQPGGFTYAQFHLPSYEEKLTRHAAGLKEGNRVLKEQTQNLLSKIDRYLLTHST